MGKSLSQTPMNMFWLGLFKGTSNWAQIFFWYFSHHIHIFLRLSQDFLTIFWIFQPGLIYNGIYKYYLGDPFLLYIRPKAWFIWNAKVSIILPSSPWVVLSLKQSSYDDLGFWKEPGKLQLCWLQNCKKNQGQDSRMNISSWGSSSTKLESTQPITSQTHSDVIQHMDDVEWKNSIFRI